MSHTLYAASVQRVQRCELAVPGSNPDMFEKAMKSGADFIFLDLEDAVAPDDKLRGLERSRCYHFRANQWPGYPIYGP
jgi:malyl-CoA/(S)-citramalyl-CoA lyase